MPVFRSFSGFRETSLSQGLLGTSSPKPTRLLSLNLPLLGHTLRKHHIVADLPRRVAIGKKAGGVFCTGYLKQ